ncbi:MAG: YfiR family protein [Candidatus Aminicenantes bacterium]|nr:YfiR family protein [Candidatus Aminicenantes bacterium]
MFSNFSQQQAASDQPYYLNPAREIDLLKKILTFERTWKARAGQELVIGILYQKGSSISSWIMEDWLNLHSHMSEAERQLEGVYIVFQKIELDSASSLEAILIENKVQILYIAPLETRNIAKILNEVVRVCGKLKIGTFTAVPEYLDSGVAISFQFKDEKAQIVINLEASRAQGFDFSSQLLRRARIRRKND